MALLSRLLTPQPRRVSRESIVVDLPDGRRIDIVRVRDPRARRMRLSVDERGARLTLPLRASLVAGDRFVGEHGAWLLAQISAHAEDEGDAFVHDETASLPLRGEDVALRWSQGRFTRLHRDAGGLVLERPARAGDAAIRRTLRDFYEAEARADIARWLPRYLAGLPRAPVKIRLKRMSSQWGSLAPNGAMALDLSLVLGTPAAFEYVLVHELCHLIHADHSAAFWREVEARCPDWRLQRDYFNAEGRRLKSSLRRLLAG